MWNIFFGFLLGRAAGRSIRPLLLLILVGSIIAGLVYAIVVFNTVSERNRGPNVHHHSTY
jgi:choline-glycine betaine transporter